MNYRIKNYIIFYDWRYEKETEKIIESHDFNYRVPEFDYRDAPTPAEWFNYQVLRRYPDATKVLDNSAVCGFHYEIGHLVFELR